MSKLYLGFDAGTQSVKVSVYDENLKSITSQSLPTILRYPHAGWVEMDLDEFLDITVRCIKRCVDDIKALGYDPKDVRAVMGDGIICGIAGVNEEGDAITPYINYLDTRTDDDVRFINDLNLLGQRNRKSGSLHDVPGDVCPLVPEKQHQSPTAGR